MRANEPWIDDEGDYDEDEPCYHCLGEGGYHDCQEDSCACLDSDGGPGDRYWYRCRVCKGTGYL